MFKRECGVESNYVGSKSLQNYVGSNCVLILSTVERSEYFITISHTYSALNAEASFLVSKF